jgi:hypothetical protein
MSKGVLRHLSALTLATVAISMGLVSGCSSKDENAGAGGTAGAPGAGGGPGVGGNAGTSGAGGSVADAAYVDADVPAILTDLFPGLTADEIAQYAAKLSGAQAVALRTELTDARLALDGPATDFFSTAQDRANGRAFDLLHTFNGGLPQALGPVAAGAFFDKTNGAAWIDLDGVMSGGKPVKLAAGDVTASVAAAAQTVQLACLGTGDATVDIVFLLDITGTMRAMISEMRIQLTQFASDLVAAGIKGTIGMVTFQDTVGVNVAFQEASPGVCKPCTPAGDCTGATPACQRSPFFAPVPLGDATKIASFQRFVARLEPSRASTGPTNAAAAIDFARNNVIGYMKDGQPNVIGDGKEDPPGTQAWPALTSSRQIFIALSNKSFYSDSRTDAGPYKARKIKDITDSLHAKRTVVHSSDPSLNNYDTTTPTGAEASVDLDYWAIQTGGIGQDVFVVNNFLAYSAIDLEALLNSDTGLSDVALPSILGSSCRASFPLASLAAGTPVSVKIAHAGADGGAETYTKDLTPITF